MTLTEEDEQIISEHPLNDTLAPVRHKLLGANDANETGQEDIANILSALVGSTAAYNLAAPDGGGNVAGKLFSVQQRVRGGTVQRDHFRALIRCVIDRATDVDLWKAVFAIIDSLSAITPPPSSIAPTFKGTPIKSSSSRLADSETRDIVEKELFFEIKECTFRNVGGFFDKFFNPVGWSAEQNSMLKALMTAHNGSKWADFPVTPDEKPVWGWFKALEQRYLCDAPHKLYTTRTANQFKERKGQMDLFLQAPVIKPNAIFKYKNVLVVGEQKKSYDKSRFKADLLQLTRYVRGVFSDQPTRRFVHAFSLCASIMELWVFDRSGPYSSGPFNIHDEPDKFAQAFVGYTTMDDDALGLDTFIKREGKHRYLCLDDSRVRLDKAMVRQRAIVCRGTTCYRTWNGHVAKLSWASDKRELEVEQLEQAEQRGVRGVAQVVAHCRITSIASIREGLEFSKPHRFKDEILHFEDVQSTTTSTSSTGTKRKSSSDHPPEHTPESKRRRSNSQRSTLAAELNKESLVSKPKPSLYTSSNELWENRIYSCLVVSPAGRVISDFRTIKELLESMQDAIKAHQSLYITGNILHRDISSNNIITNPKVANGFKGMLIDLDLAKENNSGPSGARHQTGTMQFMAVEVLRTADHTYRHDLESFFYVLLWLCARQSWRNGFAGEEKPPKESLLRRWEVGRFQDIADAKEGHMTVNGLERIMAEFPESFNGIKSLCLKTRTALFGDTARLVFGTPAGDPAELYDSIIGAYDAAIGEL
ncbi:serine/threonine-protein kinase Sgk2 [Trichoderma compactum]